jgi:hypothetical protein
MDFNLGEEVRRAVEEALKRRGIVNIVVAGRSGVGKSTLGKGVPSRRRPGNIRRMAFPWRFWTPAAWKWSGIRRP